MSKTRVAILGGGPAGLGLAYRLASRDGFSVTVLERNDRLGGNAGSFELAGMRVDYGSHRLHPACPPEIFDDIRGFLGPDLLQRPRHGRIRLRGRWVGFPLKPLNLLTNLPPDFVLGFVADLLPRRRQAAEDSFASVLEAGLGRTICRDFYFPYARKIWGIAPEDLDAEQARRRVSSASRGRIIRKMLASVPGLGSPGAGIFYYPRLGYGQISDAYHQAASAAGAEIRLRSEVTSIALHGAEGATVATRHGDETRTLQADIVLSSIPLTITARVLEPGPPAAVGEALGRMQYRAMVLVYLVLPAAQFTEYDAHYFPGLDVFFSRISEPANYGLNGPDGHTVLCVEIPCTAGDEVWRASDAELTARVVQDMASVGLKLPAATVDHAVRRLANAYPVYNRGYQHDLSRIEAWLAQQPRLVSFGRQGLFVHDNTHHTLAMAYALADSIDDSGNLISDRWQAALASFESFVVED